MPACIHGNVCRAWMEKYNTPFPLRIPCPGKCEYFESTKDQIVDRLENVEYRLKKLEMNHD